MSGPPTNATPIDAAEAAFVARLAAHLGGPPPTFVGEGSNNWVYRLETPTGEVALKLGKPHRAGSAEAEHRKELWCANAAADAGVATPRGLAIDRFEGRSYLLQAFVAGRPPSPDEAAAVWRALGGWARTFQAIPIAGWGDRLIGEGAFDGHWQAHVAYNLAELVPGDPLIALGVLDAARCADLRRRFERLATRPFVIGLCHGDLAPHNVLVAGDGALTLIDWGCAFAGPIPHYEINEVLRAGRATPGELDAFRRGYGLSDAAWAEVQADLPDLLALREIDTLRWGLVHRPGGLGPLIRSVRSALARLVSAPT